MRILWLANLFTERAVAEHEAISPAANSWQLELISALRNERVDIELIGHLPAPLWPKGKYRPVPDPTELVPAFSQRSVTYLNIPGLRSTTLKMAYRSVLLHLADSRDIGEFILTYNARPFVRSICLLLQQKFSTLWIPCIAEAGDAEGPRYTRDLLGAAGQIHLSYHQFVHSTHHNLLFLDGGVSLNQAALPTVGRSKRLVGVFAGGGAEYSGLDQLLQAIPRLQNKNVEIVICGKGTAEKAKVLRDAPVVVRFEGFVSETRLASLLRAADFFINPRPEQLSLGNFPSKLLRYMTYARPIVSTWTAGLHPDYRHALVIAESSPEGLARTIDEVVEWSPDRHSHESAKVAEFVRCQKAWSIQANRLVHWLKKLRDDRGNGGYSGAK